MDLEGDWIPSFANDMQGVVAFVKRKEQPSGEGDIGHEEDQDEDEDETQAEVGLFSHSKAKIVLTITPS